MKLSAMSVLARIPKRSGHGRRYAGSCRNKIAELITVWSNDFTQTKNIWSTTAGQIFYLYHLPSEHNFTMSMSLQVTFETG